jgi:hypothetical protein
MTEHCGAVLSTWGEQERLGFRAGTYEKPLSPPQSNPPCFPTCAHQGHTECVRVSQMGNGHEFVSSGAQ